MLELLLSTTRSDPVVPPSIITKLADQTINIRGGFHSSCLDALGENIYFASGKLANNTPTNVFNKYNIATGVWTQLANTPGLAVDISTLTCIDNFIYYTRGSNLSRYNISTNGWADLTGTTTGSAFNLGRQGSFVRNGLIHYVGSPTTAAQGTGAITTYNPTSSVRGLIYQAPTGGPRWGFGPMAYSSKTDSVYVISSPDAPNVIMQYSFTQGRLPNITIPFDSGYDGVAVVKGDWLYFGGGYVSSATDKYSTKFYRMHLTTNVFEAMPDLPQSSYACSGVLAKDNIYLLGGALPSAQYNTGFWTYSV